MKNLSQKLYAISATSLLVALFSCQSPAKPTEEKPVENKPAPVTPTEDKNKETDPTPTPEATIPNTPPSNALADGPKVTLLSAGTAAKQALRFQVKEGTKFTSTMTMKVDLAIKVNGQSPPTPPNPSVQMKMNINVLSVDPAGDIKYEFVMDDVNVIADPSIPDAMKQAVEQGLQGIKGVKGTATTDSRGFNKGAEVTLPPDAAPQLKPVFDNMKQSLASFSIPFPEEEVGVGAEWKVEQTITQSGMKLNQISNMKLLSIDGQMFTMSIQNTLSGDTQEITAPGMPPTAKATLQSFESKGSGEMKINATKIMPDSAEISSTADINMKTESAGQKQEMEMKMNMNIKIESK